MSSRPTGPVLHASFTNPTQASGFCHWAAACGHRSQGPASHAQEGPRCLLLPDYRRWLSPFPPLFPLHRGGSNPVSSPPSICLTIIYREGLCKPPLPSALDPGPTAATDPSRQSLPPFVPAYPLATSTEDMSSAVLAFCWILDLGPPALDELHDLLDLELGQVEVLGQDLLGELYKDAAINALAGKEADHVLREPDEAQAAGDLLKRQHGQVRRGLPGGAIPIEAGRWHLNDSLGQVKAGDASLSAPNKGRWQGGDCRPDDNIFSWLKGLGRACWRDGAVMQLPLRGGRTLKGIAELRGGGTWLLPLKGFQPVRRASGSWAGGVGGAGKGVKGAKGSKAFWRVGGFQAGAAVVALDGHGLTTPQQWGGVPRGHTRPQVAIGPGV